MVQLLKMASSFTGRGSADGKQVGEIGLGKLNLCYKLIFIAQFSISDFDVETCSFLSTQVHD